MTVLQPVPCNGCTNCCRNDAVRILPQEDASKWKTEPHPYREGALVLAHKPNRECVYLIDSGCSIQDDKPILCQEMDCRVIAASIGYTRARRLDKHGALPLVVWLKGKQLLKEAK